ncbi:flagellar export protein FliJ [Comamonas sp. NLF-1-9]|uniref:flagellar export protein FliJ n=1 Tax=Comamonas sp. NLF-1-9 TaxID=2853163 RepID=UPI001C47FFD0|nr:flagellar export protein FliJ [Comamonas sp. NLF-1-9]QXL84264.1 flagellar export protein FliJ [Comamonas sp. NLF-1-9]
MASNHAFEVAIELATRQRDGARNTLVQLRGHLARAQMQLHQLASYAQETRQRWSPREGAQLQPEVLRHQRQFLQRLEHTMQMQQGVVHEHEQRIARAAAVLAAAEARLASLRQVLERRLRALAQQQARREQKQTDELAMQRHVRGAGRQLTQGI